MKVTDRKCLRDFEVGWARCPECQTKGSLWPKVTGELYICSNCQYEYDDANPTPQTLKAMSW